MDRMTKVARIRTVNAVPATHENRQMVLLQDPLGIARKSVLIPPEITPLLMLCDGSRSIDQVQSDLAGMYGFELQLDEIQAWLSLLDDAAMLENENFQIQKDRALTEYRGNASRQMTLADDIYPAKQEELGLALEPYLTHASTMLLEGQFSGMICPHIDYFRGWRVYAEVMAQARNSIREAELIVMLGTDHFDDGNPLSLTQQSYRTPYGILETPLHMVDSLQTALPQLDLFAGELRHRYEHSIELALVWLHHMRQGITCDVLPILCGSHDLFFKENGSIEHSWVPAFIHELRELIQEKQTLIVAAADLAHVGLAFGGAGVNNDGRAEVALADEKLLQQVKEVNPQAFIDEITAVDDRYNVCGTTPIYLLLRLLAPSKAHVVSYELCPADPTQTSWVSVCGALVD
jgi:AmmeMemoRadiSam system protein B